MKAEQLSIIVVPSILCPYLVLFRANIINNKYFINKSKTAHMDFRNNDPGAVQFGNFINYYQFNSAEERLKLFPKDIWLPENESNQSDNKSTPYFVLDVGCNSGVLTQLIYTSLKEILDKTKRKVLILGIDIDKSLIERAVLENKHPDAITFQCVDVMDEIAFQDVINEYLKHSLDKRFDAVCCLSITMWIHLNHNDEGLKLFLRKLSDLAKLFVVEPQPWKCYQTAERRLKKAGEEFPLFLQLKWRSNVEQEIQIYLEKTLLRNKAAECDPTKWKRRICFYR